jgi:hypothetical protein
VKHKLATTLLVVAALVVATLTLTSVTTARPALAAAGGPWPIDTYGLPKTTDSVILKWDEQLLASVRANPAGTGPTVTARALGILHTATYDAWAAYDPVAKATQPNGNTKQPVSSDPAVDKANKSKAISFAAYKTLVDLFPSRQSIFAQQMTDLTYTNFATDMSAAAMVGNKAADAVISFRHADGSNQTNSGNSVTYPDPCTTNCYQAKNTWDKVTQEGMWHWQPLCVLTQAGVDQWNTGNQIPLTPGQCETPSSPSSPYYTVQKPLHPQWGNITPFGPQDPYPPQFPLKGPPTLADGSYDPTDVNTALSDTSNLSDVSKAKAEYWADGPKSEFPPGHMALFAQAMSRMRQNTLDQDVKLFFVLGNALMDASISAWASKYQYDFWRPTTAIRELYRDKLVTSWLGPKKGYGKVLGQNWVPYQALNVVTPAFPEYVSGHSTFSAAGRTVLAAFYGNENFGARVTIKAGSSQIEPGLTPAKDVVLSWKTLSDAADEAGMSRRYGGIHFWNGDQQGRVLGRLIGYNDWNLAQTYFNPTP